jgi:hypothetical protein
MCNRFVGSILLVSGLLFSNVLTATAQERSFAISTGVFNFDLSGTGNSPLLAFSADCPIRRNILFEGGITFAFPEQQFGDRTKFVIPEAMVQYQWTRGRWAPFAGGGIGLGIDLRDEIFGGTKTNLALSGGGGVRVSLTDAVGVRGEMRLRGFDTDFSGSAAELRGGIFWRF